MRIECKLSLGHVDMRVTAPRSRISSGPWPVFHRMPAVQRRVRGRAAPPRPARGPRYLLGPRYFMPGGIAEPESPMALAAHASPELVVEPMLIAEVGTQLEQ